MSRGADKLWALKSSLEIPLAHIASVRADPETAHGWYHLSAQSYIRDQIPGKKPGDVEGTPKSGGTSIMRESD